MNTSWRQAMKMAISDVLETMFFVMIDFTAPAEAVRDFRFHSSIDLCNDVQRVEVTFRVAESFARMITANFLAKREEEVLDEEMEDVMRELANMVCGNTMSRIDSVGWSLGIPTLEPREGVSGQVAEGMPLWYMGESVGMVDFRASLLTGESLPVE